MHTYFEDIEVGDSVTAGAYEVTAEEMIDFARSWDPLPIHVDAESAARSAHGGLIASGQYTLAVKQKLYTRTRFIGPQVIGAIGWNEVRFLSPVRPGQRLYLTSTCLSKRESRSKPDRGIVEFRVMLTDQDDQTVLSYVDLVMVRRRPAPERRTGSDN